MSKKIDVHKESIKIISVAAFCFSIVSFITTATGLGEFIFTEKQAWQAAIISFSIQSILFVFNLRLPGYFNKINNNIAARNIVFKFLKKIAIDSLFIIFYICILIASSLFSFVYIYDASYLSRDINHVDADIVLTNEYNSALKNYNNYVNNEIKTVELQMNKKLGELIELLPKSDVEALSLNELESKYEEAESKYKIAVAAYERKKEELDSYNEMIQSYIDSGLWVLMQKIDEINLKKEEVNQVLSELNDEKVKAETERDNAKNELEHYEKPNEEIAKDFLIKLIQSNLSEITKDDESYLDDAMSKISEMVKTYIQMEDGDNSFSEMVNIVQELNILKDEYIKLNASMNVNSLNEPVTTNETEIDDNTVWRNEWREKYDELEDSINMLQNYNATADIERLARYKREYLTDISVIEKSWLFLIDKNRRYPFNVRFSAAFAVFLDISSLLVGLFIYYYEIDKNKTEK